MSLDLIRPYFRAQVSSLGFEEWPDGYGDDNIPATILDRSFHQRVISVDGRAVNQETIEYMTTHSVKVFFKGFNDPSSAIDQGILDAQSIIVKCMKLSDYTTAGLKGIFFDSMTVDPYDETANDNIIVATIIFNIRVFNCLI